MKLIAITRPDFFEGEAEAINLLLANGLERLHLRKPHAKTGEIEALLQQIPAVYHDRISLHDGHELATAYGIGGIHLNARHPVVPCGFGGRISRSCHSLEEVRRYKDTCDYVFLSPIFDSISKAGYASAFSPDDLRAADKLIDSRVIALGGIDADKINTVRDWGFGGVAVLGSVWSPSGAGFLDNFRRLMRQTEGKPRVVLSIAGSDSSGGAGIQADIKTLTSLGVYAASVVTALTAQNTCGVSSIHPVPADQVAAQLRAVLTDLRADAIKIGMVHDESIVRVLAQELQGMDCPIVYDPVMISTSGHRLMEPATVEAVCARLLPCSTLLTPNLHEAGLLTGRPVGDMTEMEEAARRLSARFGLSILVKGGHLEGDTMCDLLYNKEGNITRYPAPKVDSRNLHGTGCTLSSAIAAFLALGNPVEEAVRRAKNYVHQAIVEARPLHIGHGQGPLWHFF